MYQGSYEKIEKELSKTREKVVQRDKGSLFKCIYMKNYRIIKLLDFIYSIRIT